MTELTQQRLLSLVYLDENKVFHWRVNRGTVKAGDPCGRPAHNGVRRIWIDGLLYGYKRLLALYVTGVTPPLGSRNFNPRLPFREADARFEYDPVLGTVTHKDGRRQGEEVGTVNSTGYRKTRVSYYRTIPIQVLAWLLSTGGYPPKGMTVDHINTNRLDNRFFNLRLATSGENGLNSTIPRHNKTGYKGVSKVVYKSGEIRYRAAVKRNRIYVLHKTFATIEEANEACIEARELHHGHYANHGEAA